MTARRDANATQQPSCASLAPSTPPQWNRRFAWLAAGGVLTVVASLGLPHLLHGSAGERFQAEFGISHRVLATTLAGMVCGMAILLLLMGCRSLRRITSVLQAHEYNLAALRQSEARTAGILASALDCIISMDAEGKITEFNKAAENTFGYTRAQVLGCELAEVLVPMPLRQVHRSGLKRFLATGQSTVLNQRIEVSALRADGSEIPVELAVSPIILDDQITFTAYLRDLSEQKRTQEALRRQALAFANISDGVILTSLEGRIIDCNAAAEKMFGYAKEDLLGKSPSILHKPEESGVLTTKLIERMRRDGRWTGETQFRRKDGTLGLCNTVLVPLCDEQGKRLATIRVNRDITDQKSAEQRQTAQHAVTRALAEATTLPEAVGGVLRALGESMKWSAGMCWTVDRSSYVLRCAHFWHPPHLPLAEFRAACQQTTLGPGVGLTGRAWCAGEVVWTSDLARDDNSLVTPQALNLGLRGGLAVPILLGEEFYGVLTFYLEQEGTPPDELLKMLNVAAAQFSQFIERRRADEALKMQAAVLENMAEGVLVADEDGRIYFTNPAFDAIFGYERGLLVGQHVGVLNRLTPEENLRVLSTIFQELKFRGSWFGQFNSCKQDSTAILTSARMSALELGGKKYLVSVQLDVTEQKRAEEELQRAKEAAEAGNRLKSEFLANMSHEIRTPLNGIIGMTELALDTELSREQWEYLDMVKTSAEALLEVINDVLDFSKIEAGKLDLDPIEFRLRNTLADTVKPLGLRAHKKNLELACHVAPEVPDGLVGDPGRLRQVLVNLVGNAIKFTEEGEVVVHADVESQTAAVVVLHFMVRDTGIGIPADKQQIIFEAFAQADGSTTRKYGGTGLGLAISSQLVHMMGGKIWVTSEVGQGSTFHFTARFGLQEDPLTRSIPGHILKVRDLPVLVVDDNATNRHILEKMLSSWRMVATPARDGPTALDLLEQARNAGSAFPLVLLDAHMPEPDGFTVAEVFQQEPELAGAVVMMLTADDLTTNLARCKSLGIHSYVMKPIKQSDLLEAILLALRISLNDDERRPALPAKAPKETAQRLDILLAEDHSVNQRLATRLLEKRGHAVVLASNGREALERLAQRQFDLVLMDLQMPEMSGFEAVASLRAEEARGVCFSKRGGRLPVLALTAHAMPGDRERCLGAGMDGYLSKPIKPDALWNAVREVVPSAPAAQAEPVPRPAEPAPEPLPKSVEAACDARALLSRLDGDAELLRELVGLFLEDCPRLRQTLREAITAESLPRIKSAAHTLKGSVANFSATEAWNLTQRIETLAQEGDLPAIEQAFALLERALERLAPALVALTPELVRS